MTHMNISHVSVNKAITVSDNGLVPNRRQAIIWTNAGLLLIKSLNTNLNFIQTTMILYKKMHFKKMAVILSRPQCQ